MNVSDFQAPLASRHKLPADSKVIARVDGVTKSYRGRAALSNVSLSIHEGVTGLLGPNGSGKSTLIKSLLGLVRAQQGEGQVLDFKWPQQVRSIRDSVGYLPEDDCYIAGLTGIESVAFMAELSGLPAVEGLRRSHEIMDFCDINEERYREVEGYSTGMRQKLKFAQALVHDPPLLILDEPTTGLDPDQRASMLARIGTLATEHGKSVILSTHILPDVQTVCNQVIMLVNGTVRVVDTLENLSRPETPTAHISVIGEPSSLIERLTSAYMSVVINDDQTLSVTGLDLDHLENFWAFAAETKTQIRSLIPATNSLEKIFFEAAAKESTSS